MSRTVIALQFIPTDHNAQAVGNVIWKECIIRFADDQAPTASAAGGGSHQWLCDRGVLQPCWWEFRPISGSPKLFLQNSRGCCDVVTALECVKWREGRMWEGWDGTANSVTLYGFHNVPRKRRWSKCQHFLSLFLSFSLSLYGIYVATQHRDLTRCRMLCFSFLHLQMLIPWNWKMIQCDPKDWEQFFLRMF